MKKLIVIFLALPIVAFANDNFVGLWQYPDRSVWVQIAENNKVFQCRIDIDGSVIKSKGKLSEATITWEVIWGKDILTIKNGKLYLNGKYGKFGFIPSTIKIIEKCKNPL